MVFSQMTISSAMRSLAQMTEISLKYSLTRTRDKDKQSWQTGIISSTWGLFILPMINIATFSYWTIVVILLRFFITRSPGSALPLSAISMVPSVSADSIAVTIITGMRSYSPQTEV